MQFDYQNPEDTVKEIEELCAKGDVKAANVKYKASLVELYRAVFEYVLQIVKCKKQARDLIKKAQASAAAQKAAQKA